MATSTENWLKLEVGQAFVRAHQCEVIGVLRGRDRLRRQVTLRRLYDLAVMEST